MKKKFERIGGFFILFLSFYIVSPSIDRFFSERNNDEYLGDTRLEWTYKARIAGYAVEPDESDEEIDEANVGFSYFWKIFEFGVFSEFNHDPEKGSDSSLQIFLWIGF